MRHTCAAKKRKLRRFAHRQNSGLQRVLVARARGFEHSLDSALGLFELQKHLNGGQRKAVEKNIEITRINNLKSLKEIRANYYLDPVQEKLAERLENILKNNYSEDGLFEMLRLTCGLKNSLAAGKAPRNLI